MRHYREFIYMAAIIIALWLIMLLVAVTTHASPTLARVPWTTQWMTWYGPGYYGRGTACGQTYDEYIKGVAVPLGHRWKCGDKLTIMYRGRIAHVKVIDNCSCTIDLSAATAMKLENVNRRPYSTYMRYKRGWIYGQALR